MNFLVKNNVWNLVKVNPKNSIQVKSKRLDKNLKISYKKP